MGFDKKMGARPLARIIDNEIKAPLSRTVLFGELSNGGLVNVILTDGKIDFTIKPMLTKQEKKALKRANLESVQEDDKTAVHQS